MLNRILFDRRISFADNLFVLIQTTYENETRILSC